jgi:hypothetical protein
MDLSLTYIYKMFSSYQLKMNNSENQKLTLKINNGKNRKMILKHNPKPCQAIVKTCLYRQLKGILNKGRIRQGVII